MSSSSTSPRSGEKRARLPKMRSGNKSAAYDETNEVVYLIERRSLARDLLHTLQTVAGADRVAGGPTSLSGMPSGADNCFDIVLWRLPTSKALTKTRPSPTARARDYQAWITRVVTNDAAATVSIVVEHRTTERHNKQWERVAMDINYDILLERSPMLARLVTQIPKGRGKDTRACAKRARACGQKGGASAAVGLLHRLYDKSLATGPARRREFELDLGTEQLPMVLRHFDGPERRGEYSKTNHIRHSRRRAKRTDKDEHDARVVESVDDAFRLRRRIRALAGDIAWSVDVDRNVRATERLDLLHRPLVVEADADLHSRAHRGRCGGRHGANRRGVVVPCLDRRPQFAEARKVRPEPYTPL